MERRAVRGGWTAPSGTAGELLVGMLSERGIWASARLLLEYRGRNAVRHARSQQMALLRAGDADAADMWRQVAVAVRALEADATVADKANRQANRQADAGELSRAS